MIWAGTGEDNTVQESSPDNRPRGATFVAIALVLFVGFIAFALRIVAQVDTWELKRFDWTAFGALASAGAAIISLIVGLAAVYAARIALSNEARSSKRIRERDRRDAVPLAYVLQSELLTLRGMAVGPRLLRRGIG